MPTPFTHLAVATEILSHPDLAPGAQTALAAELPAFLFGNIAPDVQTVSGQPREATHFFPVPLNGAPPAGRVLLGRHPDLAQPASLPPAQAAFLAGYLAHLVFDQLWISQIFEPVFGPAQDWADFRERLYRHNALRAPLDGEDLRRLLPGTAAQLKAAEPSTWLPFEADPHLRTWRDLVADQLGPGAGRTVEVFAERMRVDPAAFARLLASPDELQRRVLSRLPAEALSHYRASALQAAAGTINSYLRGDPLPSQL
jgi:hypothetical protein